MENWRDWGEMGADGGGGIGEEMEGSVFLVLVLADVDMLASSWYRSIQTTKSKQEDTKTPNTYPDTFQPWWLFSNFLSVVRTNCPHFRKPFAKYVPANVTKQLVLMSLLILQKRAVLTHEW